jgi:hypothetical protein
MDCIQLLPSPYAVRILTELSESVCKLNDPSPNINSNYRHATDREMSHFRYQITRYNEVVVIFLVYCRGWGVSLLVLSTAAHNGYLVYPPDNRGKNLRRGWIDNCEGNCPMVALSTINFLQTAVGAKSGACGERSAPNQRIYVMFLISLDVKWFLIIP